LLPSPTAPSWSSPVFVSCRGSVPKGKLLPSAILARSLRRRAGLDRLPSLLGSFPGSRLRSRPFGPPFASTRLCRRLPAPRSGPKTLARCRSAPAVPVLASAWFPPFLAEASSPCLGPVRYPPPVSILASQSRPVRPPSVRSRPFLGRSVFRAALKSLAEPPACGGETIISSGASCRLRSGDPSPLVRPGFLGRPEHPWN
jgi:hypothetical protein